MKTVGEALLDSGSVECHRLGVCREIGAADRQLIGKHLLVHLAALALFSRTVHRFMSLERLRMNRFDREVAEDILHASSLDVLPIDLRKRLMRVPGAKRALVIGKLDDGNLRIALSVEGRAIDVDEHLLERDRKTSCRERG